MGDVINLRAARKAKARKAADATAQENRAAFGQSKAERERLALERLLEERRNQGHRRGRADADGADE